MELIREVEKGLLSENGNVKFRAGDVVTVGFQVKEGAKVRVQSFRGTVIQRRGQGATETFTVRKAGANGVFVERIFPLHSPLIESIKLEVRGKVRRARIFYLRERIGKAARIKELKKVD